MSQSFSDFEIVVVVNCVDDNTSLILNDFSDSRIRLFETDICQIAFNLNYGLMVSRGTYIARIDSDDMASHKRLELQLGVIKEYDFDVVGSNVRLINKDGVFIGNKTYPECNHQIRKEIFYSNPIVHPSVMYKKEVLLRANGYLNGLVSEDYDLWIRLMRDKDVRFYNIQEELTDYRIHSLQSMGSGLAYAEVSGYFIREAIYQKSIVFFFYFFVSILKSILK